MPLYDYQCDNCGHRFEVRQGIKEDALTICPQCQQSTLRRVIHPVGIVFKGSGFYITDSRNSSSVATPPASSSSSSESKPSGESSTTTPAAPTTPASSTPSSES